MAYEPSEIMFAAAMLFSDDQLKKYSKDRASLEKFMPIAQKKASSSIRFGNQSIKNGFIELMEPTDKGLKDLAVGISAAMGMRKQVPSKELKDGTATVYMTGNVWPAEVEKFRVSAHGFSDYNSADVLFTYNGSKFYGVSLKKKSTPTAAEPTLINKAFDTILEGKQFEGVKKELINTRVNYFADLVIQAVNKGIIKKTDIKDFDKLKKTTEGKKELFEAKKRDKTKFDRSYIDTKGSAKAKGKYKDENMTDTGSMRYFVNKQLADPNNPLWSQFITILNKHSEMFGESLINIILKTKLYDHITAKDLKRYKFGFFLVTGIGSVAKENVTIQPAQIMSLETTLCGLTRIEEQFEGKPYKIELNKAKKSGSDAAKVFLQLKRGKVTLLDLELRYKGAFTSQPQFQGTLNQEFKTLLKSECGL